MVPVELIQSHSRKVEVDWRMPKQIIRDWGKKSFKNFRIGLDLFQDQYFVNNEDCSWSGWGCYFDINKWFDRMTHYRLIRANRRESQRFIYIGILVLPEKHSFFVYFEFGNFETVFENLKLSIKISEIGYYARGCICIRQKWRKSLSSVNIWRTEKRTKAKGSNGNAKKRKKKEWV